MLKLTGVIFGAFVTLVNCSDKTIDKTGSDAAVDSTKGNTDDGTEGKDMMLGFTEDIHPYLVEKCGGCHASTAPKITQSESISSYNEIIAGKKVNFADPAQSRLVLRLSPESHNCWGDCAENAAEMTEKLSKWVASSKALDSQNHTDISNLKKTAEFTMSAASAMSVAFTNMDIGLEAESGDLTNAESRTNDNNDPDISAGFLAFNQNGGQLTVEQLADPNTYNRLGKSVLEFSVSAAGKYYLFVRARQGNGRSMFFKINGGTPILHTFQQDQAAMVWMAVDTDEAPGVPLAVDLVAGNNRIEIIQRENGVSIDAIALMQRQNRDPSLATLNAGKPAVLNFDLASILPGTAATISVQLSKFNDKSFLLGRPTLRNATKPIRIKGIRPLLNGTYDDHHNSYTLVDVTSSGDAQVLSATSLVMTMKNGEATDKFSLAFDLIELVP